MHGGSSFSQVIYSHAMLCATFPEDASIDGLLTAMRLAVLCRHILLLGCAWCCWQGVGESCLVLRYVRGTF